MRLPIQQEIPLVSLLQSPPYNAIPKPIQYGTQYVLQSGVICNFQYSKKTPDEFKFYVQNHAANFEQAEVIEQLAARQAIGD
ncbi:Uncharacterised protein [Klebsiella variicola]|uniref:hypothetical protein n=1 Tax=Klebsiella aerogenes TaxID=548 RepID=UPI000E2BEEE9|nr:hypothetical protein [Klebsiella aerogenes]MDN3810037.1 hypothetical protein [Klebsiella aerogenes]MDT7007342.1 hypothetical protein [Klebsiella variicola]MDT7029213.1 hypothetical protein [Klebsiella variicola]SXF42619.1 Uncharacterised protein [Klebsiella variicola]